MVMNGAIIAMHPCLPGLQLSNSKTNTSDALLFVSVDLHSADEGPVCIRVCDIVYLYDTILGGARDMMD